MTVYYKYKITEEELDGYAVYSVRLLFASEDGTELYDVVRVGPDRADAVRIGELWKKDHMLVELLRGYKEQA